MVLAGLGVDVVTSDERNECSNGGGNEGGKVEAELTETRQVAHVSTYTVA